MSGVKLTGKDAGNYVLSAQPSGVTVSISRIAYNGTTTATGSAKYGGSNAVDLSSLIMSGGRATVGTASDGNGILNTCAIENDTSLSFSFKDTATVDDTATVTVNVSDCTNYTDYTLAVTLTVRERDLPVVTAPTAVANLTYNGTPQTLITAGTTSGGTLQYSTDNSTWSTELPKAENAATYTVYYRVLGNADYADTAVNSISVTISASPDSDNSSSASGNDAGSNDTNGNDTNGNNTGSNDTSGNDAGSNDSGSNDTNGNDAGSNNTGSNDTGSNDTGGNDAGSNNTGSNNTGSNDTNRNNADGNDADGNDDDGNDADGNDADGNDTGSNDAGGNDADGNDDDGNDDDSNAADSNDTNGNDTGSNDADSNDTAWVQQAEGPEPDDSTGRNDTGKVLLILIPSVSAGAIAVPLFLKPWRRKSILNILRRIRKK